MSWGTAAVSRGALCASARAQAASCSFLLREALRCSLLASGGQGDSVADVPSIQPGRRPAGEQRASAGAELLRRYDRCKLS